MSITIIEADSPSIVMTDGYSGVSGFSGFSSYSGVSGVSGFSAFSGKSGASGYSAFSGVSGFSAFSGVSGFSGYSSFSGYSGISGKSGYSGISGSNGSGSQGVSGTSGISGKSGYSGVSGYSAFSGVSGYSGASGQQAPLVPPVRIGTPSVDDSAADVQITSNNKALVLQQALSSGLTSNIFEVQDFGGTPHNWIDPSYKFNAPSGYSGQNVNDYYTDSYISGPQFFVRGTGSGSGSLYNDAWLVTTINGTAYYIPAWLNVT